MRDFLTKDLGWKLFSVLLALVIWLSVRTISRDRFIPARSAASWATHTFDQLPVVPFSAAADVREFKVKPGAVLVVVGGPAADMVKLQRSEIRPVVDLTGIETADSLKQRVDVFAPPGMTVVRVVPPEVDVVLPPKSEK